MRARHPLAAALLLALTLVASCGLLPEDEPASGGSDTAAATPSLDPVPACNTFDIGPVFDAFGGQDPAQPPSAASIGSTRGCAWSPPDPDVGLRAKVTVLEDPDLSDAGVLAYAQQEWADATGGEPFPADQFRPGEHGWSYGMTSTVPIIQILTSSWLTLLTPDGALRCHYWGFKDPAVAWAACDQIRAAVETPA
ncbi:hypothetical protein [Aeromicrobium sp. Leaf350]|uniref:hypothetical protein n=1 Tax=Aeromicrobium sp. Leaf350 TaxID=2876565 RepID=UPI001E5C83EA|nr:hypothetical protein [Aeromicrobium sp. Leaf350]